MSAEIPLTGWSEDDLIPVSGVEHYAYCPRQFALIHVESVWDENVFTIRGQQVHRRADDPGIETRAGLRVERALPVWSERLGLIGRCDVVEFLPDGTPYPVELKPGRSGLRVAHDAQVCAQALCLEEMFGRPVDAGAVSYLGSHRRREVPITAALRNKVEDMIQKMRDLLRRGVTPPPVYDTRCRDCSLVEACVPEVLCEIRATSVAQALYGRVDL